MWRVCLDCRIDWNLRPALPAVNHADKLDITIERYGIGNIIFSKLSSILPVHLAHLNHLGVFPRRRTTFQVFLRESTWITPGSVIETQIIPRKHQQGPRFPYRTPRSIRPGFLRDSSPSRRSSSSRQTPSAASGRQPLSIPGPIGRPRYRSGGHVGRGRVRPEPPGLCAGT